VFSVESSLLSVHHLVFIVYCVLFIVWGLACTVYVEGYRVSNVGFKLQVEGLEFRV